MRKKTNSGTIGLCVAFTVVTIAIPLTTLVDTLEQDALMTYFTLALRVAFHGSIALIVRGVRGR